MDDEVTKAVAAIKAALRTDQRASGRKVNIPFKDTTLTIVDSGTKWVLRTQNGLQLAKSIATLPEALVSFSQEASDEDDEEHEVLPRVGSFVRIAKQLSGDQQTRIKRVMESVTGFLDRPSARLMIAVSGSVSVNLESHEPEGDQETTTSWVVIVTNSSHLPPAARVDTFDASKGLSYIEARLERMVRANNDWSQSTTYTIKRLGGETTAVADSSQTDESAAELLLANADMHVLWEVVVGDEESDEEGSGMDDDAEGSEGAYAAPKAGEHVEVAHDDDWKVVLVAKCNEKSFSVYKDGDSGPTQRVYLDNTGWRPVSAKSAVKAVNQASKAAEEATKAANRAQAQMEAADVVATATVVAEKLDSKTAEARASFFTSRRAELDKTVDASAKDADDKFYTNIKNARRDAEKAHPSTSQTTALKKAIAEVEAKRSEVAEAEAELETLLEKVGGSSSATVSSKKRPRPK